MSPRFRGKALVPPSDKPVKPKAQPVFEHPPPPPKDGSPAYVLRFANRKEEDIPFQDLCEGVNTMRAFGRRGIRASVVRVQDGTILAFTAKSGESASDALGYANLPNKKGKHWTPFA